MATEPQHSEIVSVAATSSEAAAPPPEQRDIGGDAAVILAALGRMEAAVREDRAALRQLRTSLLDMAQAIAGAKHVADSEAATAMLDEFEHRVDAMIEIAGGHAASQPQQGAEPDQVPTVSGVVSQLGPTDAATDPATADTAQPAEPTAGSSPTVAMLTAMVEALSASIQVPAPETEVAQTVQEAQNAQEAQAPEPAQMIEATPPADPALETALLASFVRMETRPFPPPDEGTAVIFTRPEPQPKPAPDDESWSPAPSEPAVTAAPEQAAAPEVAEIPPAIEPEVAEAAPPTTTATATMPPEAEFDPSDFLFGPEPEPDPAAFLLDPAPPPRKAVLPQAEFVTVPPPQETPAQEMPATEEAPAAEAEPSAQSESAPEPAPDDPLRALKAMTENERPAIFS
jgi:hypothetical protein